MSWFFEASGLPNQRPLEVVWWPLVKALGQAAHIALAGAYFVVIAHVLRVCAWRERVRSLSELFRHVSVLLCFCALAHAIDALASSLTTQRLVTAPSVLAAVFASVAATRLPRLARSMEGPTLIPPSLPAPSEVTPHSAIDPLVPIVARVEELEDIHRRNAWLRQRHDVVRGLGELLGGPVLEGAAGFPESTSGRPDEPSLA